MTSGSGDRPRKEDCHDGAVHYILKAITSINGPQNGQNFIFPNFVVENDPNKHTHTHTFGVGGFTFQYFVFFLIFAFSCLSCSSFPLLKSGPSNEVIGLKNYGTTNAHEVFCTNFVHSLTLAQFLLSPFLSHTHSLSLLLLLLLLIFARGGGTMGRRGTNRPQKSIQNWQKSPQNGQMFDPMTPNLVPKPPKGSKGSRTFQQNSPGRPRFLSSKPKKDKLSREGTNFSATTPSRGRPPPHRAVSGPKKLIFVLCFLPDKCNNH